jgi:vacuolar-type H+-ATPase subunit H
MSQVIEETIKALTEFEAELDKTRSDTVEVRKRLAKSAGDWAEEAKTEAIAHAQKIAQQRLETARAEAEAEAESIKSAGRTALQSFKETITGNKKEAVQLVTKRLLGAKS